MFKNKLIWVIYIIIIAGLCLFFNNYRKMHNALIVSQKTTLEHLRSSEQNNVFVRSLIIHNKESNYCNDININPQNIYLCIDYPVCATCFETTITSLYEYAKKEKKSLEILCDRKHISEIRKKIRFSNHKDILVNYINDIKRFNSKFTVVFISENGNVFNLPLPEKQEEKFLKFCYD